MSDHTDPEVLRQAILRALAQVGVEQDLASIHTLLNRPQKDITLLPVVGGLVMGGYLEKVTSPHDSQYPNAPVGSSPRQRSGHPSPVRFRLTDQGRELLKSSAANAFQTQASSLDGAEAEAGEDEDGDG